MCKRVVTILLLCTICMFSTLFLQSAPAAHAASLSTSNASTAAYDFTYPIKVYHDNTSFHLGQDCMTNPTQGCNAPPQDTINSGVIQAECQLQNTDPAGEFSDLGYHNNWWVFVKNPNTSDTGWISAVYVNGQGNGMGGNDQPIPSTQGQEVPLCNTLQGTAWNTAPAQNSAPAPAQNQASAGPLLVNVYASAAKIYPCIWPAGAEGRVSGCSGTSIPPRNYPAYCQKQGSTQSDLGLDPNNWFTLIQGPNGPGWVPNLYIQGGKQVNAIGSDGSPSGPIIPVNDCSSAPAGTDTSGSYHPPA